MRALLMGIHESLHCRQGLGDSPRGQDRYTPAAMAMKFETSGWIEGQNALKHLSVRLSF